MVQETQDTVFPSRRRRHFRGYRRFKVILLALGITGMVIGLGLTGGYFLHQNLKLAKFGCIYVLVSLILLGLRGIMTYLKQSKTNTR